jgi:hypothetical protein
MSAHYKAFVAAQKAFGPALKSHTNPAFKSKYADLAACVEAVIDALNANGFALTHVTHPCESGVSVECRLIHESGGEISSGVLHVPASKQDPQGYGSALTYCRRYSLMAVCGIAPEDDDGNASRPKPAGRELVPQARPLSDTAAAQMLQAITQSPDMDSLKSTFGHAYTAAKDANSQQYLSAFKAAYEERKSALMVPA